MRPGPDILYACSSCNETFSAISWLSGNTVVSTLWSDGYLDAPDMPSPNWFAPCPRCKDPVWLEDCPNLGEDDRPELDLDNPIIRLGAAILRPQYPCFSMHTVTIQDIDRGILKATGNTARQIGLRIYCMHRANHGKRVLSPERKPEPELCSTEAREANLLALAALLEEAKGPYILLGEVYRELGDFMMATISLFDLPPEESWAGRQISAWAAAEDSTIHILQT